MNKNNYWLYVFFVILVLAGCNSKTNKEISKGQENSDSNKIQVDYYDIAYENKNNEIIVKSDSKGEYIIKNAYDPELSPNGKYITVTRIDGDHAKSDRYISIIDLNTKKEKPLGINNNNYYYASWAPDNNKFVFNVFINDTWQIGLINLDLSGYKLLKHPKNVSLYSATFSENSQHIYVSDLENLYKYNLNAELIETIPIAEYLGEDYYLSSDTKFYFFNNGENLVFLSGYKNQDIQYPYDVPPESVFLFNKNNKEVIKILPDDLYCYSLNRAGKNKVVISCKSKGNNKLEIYVFDIHTLQSKRLKEFGANPSIKYL